MTVAKEAQPRERRGPLVKSAPALPESLQQKPGSSPPEGHHASVTAGQADLRKAKEEDRLEWNSWINCKQLSL